MNSRAINHEGENRNNSEDVPGLNDVLIERSQNTPKKEYRLEAQGSQRERSSFEYAHAIVDSAEVAVKIFVADFVSQIKDIENSFDFSGDRCESLRKELGLDLEEMTSKVRLLVGKLTDKIYYDILGNLTPEEEKKVDELFDEEFATLVEGLKVNEISEPLMEEAREKRAQLFENPGISLLSDSDFDEFFSTTLEQESGVGDCYLISAINAFRKCPYFKTMVCSSIKRLADGSWEVMLPLMSKEGEIIKITPDEISPNVPRREKGLLASIKRSTRYTRGGDGMQVLEAAYMKGKFGKVDKQAVEDGVGYEALMRLGGENFIKFAIGRGSEKLNGSRKLTDSGGGRKVSRPIVLSQLPKNEQDMVDEFLENFDPELFIATVGFTDITERCSEVETVEGKMKLYHYHSYAIDSVDCEKKTVAITNPWYPLKRFIFSFSQFKEAFTDIEAIRINHAKLLENMEVLEGNRS